MQKNNKLRISSWGTVVFLLVVLFFSGCSAGNPDVGNGTDNDAIAFDCSILNSHVDTKTTINDMQYFRVSAVWNKAGTGYESFMNNLLIEKQGTNWVYSPVRNWPSLGTVSFFAYSPATSSGIESTSIDSAANKISIKYTVSNNHLQQEDFILATNINKTANPIQLKFKHVLSTTSFHTRNNNVGATLRIKEIKLTNLYSKGTITGMPVGETSTWGWNDYLGLTDYIVYQKYPFQTNDTYQEVGSLMVLPQKPDAGFKIIVSYDIIETAESKTKEFVPQNTFSFEMGERYLFYLDF